MYIVLYTSNYARISCYYKKSCYSNRELACAAVDNITVDFEFVYSLRLLLTEYRSLVYVRFCTL